MTLFDHPQRVAPADRADRADGPQPPAAPPRSAWSLPNWPVRWKVVAIALVPTVLALVFGGLRVAGALGDAGRLRLAADRAAMVPVIGDYLAALDTALVAASSAGDVQGARKRYESRRHQLRARLADAEVADDVRAGVTALLDDGQHLLDRVLANDIGLREQVTGYAPILLTAEDTINGSVRVDIDRIRAQAEALGRAVGARGQMTMAELLVNRGGELDAAELRTSMITVAGTEPSTLFGMNQVLGVDSADAKTLQQQLVTRMAVLSDPDSVLPNNPQLRDSIHRTDEIAARMIADTTGRVTGALADRAAERRTAAIRDAVLMVLALLGVLAAVGWVARSLVRPLRTLRDGALRVAHTDLEHEIARVRSGDEREPAPLPVHTTEEVGQVAHAVDELHARALLLAGDEARLRLLVNEMFQTMSRRNRSLVDQQAALIERLEAEETDPQRRDALLRLDHLAARMRRSGTNLLVLAGASSTPGRTGPTPLAGVIEAAVAEVEDYWRVQTGPVPDGCVTGPAVADIVHLLAELVDNALRYSPPSAPVRVWAGGNTGAGVTVSIVDSGLGMTDADLRMANMRLTGGGEVTPDNARQMGLFVVSRLARRHGIRVALSPAEPRAGGIAAEVWLPPALLTAERPAPPSARRPVPAPRRRPGDLPARPVRPEPVPVAAEDDVIYRRMLSEWLVDPHELSRSTDLDWKSVWDRGWSLAERAEDLPADSHTEHGLPVREPGARLVPGAPPDTGTHRRSDDAPPPRDPGAVRTSIGGHFDGVHAGRSRGRHAASDPDANGGPGRR